MTCTIPSEEIIQDIRETEREIEQLEREEEGFRLIGDRMSVFRADARRSGIKDRKAFIEKLKNILKERNPEGIVFGEDLYD